MRARRTSRVCGAAVAVVSVGLLAQSPIAPTNDAPNPYATVEGWAKMPDGRTWGSTSAVDIDPDGRSIWVAERCGAKVTRVEGEWGRVFTPDQLKAALAARPKVVGIVYAETSTGAWQPLEEISKAVHDAGALLLVDAVTALGAIPVEVDAWGIDAIYSCSQKGLSCPPGLSPFGSA